jgi:hypothetical protein
MKQIILLTICIWAIAFTVIASGKEGDIDNSGNITLQDAIMAIQITSGMNTVFQTYTSAEVSGDNKIGTSEAIYILQCISGLRTDTSVNPDGCVWDSSQWDNCLWGL